jgi:hypothetical protein
MMVEKVLDECQVVGAITIPDLDVPGGERSGGGALEVGSDGQARLTCDWPADPRVQRNRHVFDQPSHVSSFHCSLDT